MYAIRRTTIGIELVTAIALVFLSIGLLIYLRRKSKSDRYLYGLLLDAAFILISDAVAQLCSGNQGVMIYYLDRVSNFLSFWTNGFTAWFVINYVLALVEEKGNKVSRWWNILNHACTIACLIALFLNLHFKYFYYIDEANIYHRAEGFLYYHAFAAFELVLLAALLYAKRKNISRYENFAVLTYVILPLMAEIVQIFHYGFPWFPIAVAFSSFLIVLEHVIIPRIRRNRYIIGNLETDELVFQKKVIIYVCIFILVIFGGIARAVISFAASEIKHEVEAHYQQLIDKTTQEISVWIVREEQTLQTQRAALEIIGEFDPDYLTHYLEQVMSEYNFGDYMFDIYFVNEENVMSSGHGYIPEADIDFRQRGWYLRAMACEDICYEPPYIDTESGRYMVTLSCRVENKLGEPVGVLAIDIFVDTIFEIIESQQLVDNSYLFVVGNEYELITHPYELYGYVDDSNSPMKNIKTDLQDIYGELARKMEYGYGEKEYITLKDYDEKYRCFFISRVKECNWYVVAAISEDVVEHSEKDISQGIFIALVICLVLGILVTIWGTNSIVRKLSDARAEALAANEAKSRFLANMSHEIRTPINAVLGMDEILLRECQDDNIKKYALDIQGAGQALLSLVNDILDFSKIESDRLEIVNTEYALGDLVSSSTNLITLRAIDKGLFFHVERTDYLPSVLYGDEIRIRQIITNLLTNAVKYTKAGEVCLYIGWEEDCLLIKVKDTGIGIKEESMQDLFTSFIRLDEKKNRNIEGTGLGLAITKQLVELMGGTIEVQSIYGEGSEFTAKIPQKIVNASNVESFERKQQNESTKDLDEFHVDNVRILVVDDVKMNLKVVSGLLNGTGVTVDTAESGMAAISMVEDQQYDMIFLDHMMPQMDGIETFATLKEKYPEKMMDLPVIMLTANAIAGVEKEYEAEGFWGYLSKPVSREALCGVILKFVNGKEQNVKKQAVQGLETQKEAVQELNAQKQDPISIIKMQLEEFDEKLALEYCAGMPDLLLDMLKEYAASDIAERMRMAFLAKDYDSYRIAVHSLKSTSLMIGFKALSEEAKALEMAAKENQISYILENHEAVYLHYNTILGVIRNSLQE